MSGDTQAFFRRTRTDYVEDLGGGDTDEAGERSGRVRSRVETAREGRSDER